MKNSLIAVATASLLISAACAPAIPTMDPAQIQGSAIAAASTMVALTQAAVPTATENPPTPAPTPTPLPSPTLIALPTLPLGAPPTAVPPLTTSGDPCAPDAPYKPMDPGAAGPVLRNVLIKNENKGSAVLSLYLSKTPFGECGGRSFNLGANDSATVTDLKVGCYSAGAFVNASKATKSFGSFCMMDDFHKWTIVVGPEVIKLEGP